MFEFFPDFLGIRRIVPDFLDSRGVSTEFDPDALPNIVLYAVGDHGHFPILYTVGDLGGVFDEFNPDALPNTVRGR